jgi:hypothetical protein
MNSEVLHIAQQLAVEMVAKGALATVLMGSHVRGEAHVESDIDITFLGKDIDTRVERRGNYLVSLYWRKPESVISGFGDPSVVSGLVPAWRQALIIHDPQGIALKLKRQAESWQWDSVAIRCDRWVAEQISLLAEDVQRLVGNLKRGNKFVAADHRNELNQTLAWILAVHLRLFWETDNKVLYMVCHEMGERWTVLQTKALGIGDEAFMVTCEAALELYVDAVGKTKHLMNDIEYQVVEHTCTIVRDLIQFGSSKAND